MRSAVLPFVVLAGLGGCQHFDDKNAPCPNRQACQAILNGISIHEVASLSAPPKSLRKLAVIGDGIAGTAFALNHGPNTRVWGMPSFWTTVGGLPAVWQTTLDGPFDDAGLTKPSPTPKGTPSVPARVPVENVLTVNLQGLVSAKADWIGTGPTVVTPTSGVWLVVDKEGHSETTDTLIVATGVLRPVRITELISGSAAASARRALRQQGKLISADDCVRMKRPSASVVGLFGAGGAAADCLNAVMHASATSQVVVWGKTEPNIVGTKAYNDLIGNFGRRICVADSTNMRTFMLDSATGLLDVNGNLRPTCQNTQQRGNPTPTVDLYVEAIGRYAGDPPPVVLSAAAGRDIHYAPRCATKSGPLLAVQISFRDRAKADNNAGDDGAPMYLIGAAATWLPPDVYIDSVSADAYRKSLQLTVNAVNSVAPVATPKVENPPPGFAVAAYMGAHLARALKARTLGPC